MSNRWLWISCLVFSEHAEIRLNFNITINQNIHNNLIWDLNWHQAETEWTKCNASLYCWLQLVPWLCLLGLVMIVVRNPLIHTLETWMSLWSPSLNQNNILRVQLILIRSTTWWGCEYLGQIWLEKQCYLLELDPRKHPALSEYLKLERRRGEGWDTNRHWKGSLQTLNIST